jgi:copper chaperone CopZ
MSCEHCASAVRAEIGKLPGVGKVDVDVAVGMAGLLVPYASVVASRRLRDMRPGMIWEDSGL